MPNSTPMALRINSDGRRLSYRNDMGWQIFDFDTKKKRQLHSIFVRLEDSVRRLRVNYIDDWSPYNPDLMLLSVGTYPLIPNGVSPITWLVAYNLATEEVLWSIRERQVCDVRTQELALIRWSLRSVSGNDTLLNHPNHSSLHVQSRQRNRLPGSAWRIFESNDPTRTLNYTSNSPLISHRELPFLRGDSVQFLYASWSSDARLLAVFLHNLRYDSVGTWKGDTVDARKFKCSNVELVVVDVDGGWRQEEQEIAPSLRVNLQEKHCKFLPIERSRACIELSIVPSPHGTLFVPLFEPFTDLCPIYEVSFEGEILRKVVPNP